VLGTYKPVTVVIRTNTARFIIFLVAVGAVVVVMLVTGSADDKAEPGSSGRVPVTTATPDSR
jgi:hypothetical protein